MSGVTLGRWGICSSRAERISTRLIESMPRSDSDALSSVVSVVGDDSNVSSLGSRRPSPLLVALRGRGGGRSDCLWGPVFGRFGKLLDGLAGRIEPAPLIVVAGDHGEALGEFLDARGYAYDHGEFLDPEVVCVPLVVAGPGVAPGRSSGAVSLTDIYATLLGVAGLAEPDSDGEQGRDLRTASAGRRIVAVERRRLGPRARAIVRAHGAAAFDGAGGVIVGAESIPPSEGADPRAIELFQAAWRRYQATARSVATPSVDPALADALRSLGYAE